MDIVNLESAFALVPETWHPRIVGELNDCYLKLARLEGEFLWHHHDEEDELFLVVKGELRIKFCERDLVLGSGELVVIPRGVEHCPVAAEEVHVLLIEPKTTKNTGNVTSERTVGSEWLPGLGPSSE